MLNVEMQEADIFDESVFALPCQKMWKFSKRRVGRTALIPCIDTRLVHFVPIPQYLSRCGVLRRLFSLGSFHYLLASKRNDSTLFLFIITSLGVEENLN